MDFKINSNKSGENIKNNSTKVTLVITGLLKWFLAIYLLGFLLNMNSFFLSEVSSQLAQTFINSDFVTKEFIDFVDFLRSPLITLILLAIYFIPMIILMLIITLAIYRYFSKFEIKIYLGITFMLMFVLSLSAFLFG